MCLTPWPFHFRRERSLKTTAACGAGLLVLVHGTVAAAPITWQPAQNTTGAANLLTGTSAYAVNGGSAAVTVNGITFNPFNFGNGLERSARRAAP
jgi:hypothetical protein